MDEKKWVFKRQVDGKEVEENVMLENWAWMVSYKDGTHLQQFDDKGIFHQVGEIKQENVLLWSLYQTNGQNRIDLIIPQDKEVVLIHKYKNYISSADETKSARVVCFGYKAKGQTAHYNFILPNDMIIQTIGDQDPNIGDLALSL